MILVIDNYDSFTYNIVHYLGEWGREVKIYRNDALTVSEVALLDPEKIILSPGPGNPDNAGICLDLVKHIGTLVPLMGICLGHQVIGQAYGGRIESAKRIMHGKTSTIIHGKQGIFKGVSSPFTATRYHSLALARESIPDTLIITATAEDGEIMGIKHHSYPVWGLQFHPESILTKEGKKIINNFLEGEEFPC